MQMETAFAVPFLKRDDETFYDYCLSFSPAAPFFGVAWRFAPSFKIAAEDAPKAQADAAQAMVDDAVEITEKVAETLEAAVETMAASITAKAKIVEEPVEEPVEDVAEAVEETAEEVATDLLGDVSAAPEGLLSEAPAVIDDLKLIKGVGPKLEAELNGIGIYTFAQIAAMTEPQMIWLDEQISSVRGRPMRDDWAGQAKALAG